MPHHLLGQTCALLAAITWASAVVLFKRSGEQISPVGLNLYKNTVALVLLGATLAFLVVYDPAHDFDELRQFPTADFCILMLSGVIGIAVADTLFLHSLNLIGVGLISIVDCSYSPSVVLLAWIFLAEKLTVIHYVGGALIVVGVFVASRHKPPPDRTRGQIVAGVLLATLAIVAMAIGIVIAKPIIEEMALVWSTTIRFAGGAVLLALFALLGKRKREHWSVFRPSSIWKFALPGSILGTYMAMVFWVAGFKYTYATVAAMLNQMSVIFAIILAAVFLKEPFGGRKLVAVVLAMSGVAIITFSDRLHALWQAVLAALPPLTA